MIVSLALVVFGSSIAVFFSDELTATYKKIIAIRGVKLLVPLFFVSAVIEKYQSDGYWMLLWFQALLEQCVQYLMKLAPFETGSYHLAKIVYLCLLACLPAWVFWLMAKRKGVTEAMATPYRVGVILWVIAAVLLTVQV